ncbi:MAG: folate-binding protein [Rudaea sp.]
MPFVLPCFQTLELGGPDAIAFAHAQFSSDVRALGNGHWQFSAWLSPQGRVHAFFHLLQDDEEHLRLVLRGGDAHQMTAALRRFILRSKVDLRVRGDIQAFGSADSRAVAAWSGGIPTGTATAGGSGCTSLALPGDDSRWLMLLDGASSQPLSAEPALDRNRWMLADIRAGQPELAQGLEDEFLPQWLGLERLGAVSVKKGCYPGQEIIARMHFRGGNKRGLYLVEINARRAPQPGAEIVGGPANAESVGRIVMAARAGEDRVLALASLRDEFAAQSLYFIERAVGEIGARTRFG